MHSSFLQVTAAYKETPPQILVAQMNTFFRGLQPPSGFRVELQWEKVTTQEENYQEAMQESKCNKGLLCRHLTIIPLGRLRGVPLGYHSLEEAPLRRGPSHCEKCLCSPCVIQRPPDFLRGCCDPHPANAEKRYMLYRKFWRCLDRLGVWRDEGYLRRKERRTRRDDRRDVMPDCVIEVSAKQRYRVIDLSQLYRLITGNQKEIP